MEREARRGRSEAKDRERERESENGGSEIAETQDKPQSHVSSEFKPGWGSSARPKLKRQGSESAEFSDGKNVGSRLTCVVSEPAEQMQRPKSVDEIGLLEQSGLTSWERS